MQLESNTPACICSTKHKLALGAPKFMRPFWADTCTDSHENQDPFSFKKNRKGHKQTNWTYICEIVTLPIFGSFILVSIIRYTCVTVGPYGFYMVWEGRTQMQTSKTQKFIPKTREEYQNTRTVKKQSETRLWLTILWLWWHNLTWQDVTVAWKGKWGIRNDWWKPVNYILWEVIGDEVQLWNRKQVTWVKLSDRGKNMTRNLENMIKDLKTR